MQTLEELFTDSYELYVLKKSYLDINADIIFLKTYIVKAMSQLKYSWLP